VTTAIEQLAALTVGSVESVSPGEIKVLLELDAPQDTALNTGTPTKFPRINGYVLIPNETGAVVGLVVWLGVERSAFPKRTGLKDFGLLDLPFPLRKMTLTPVGTLTTLTELDDEEQEVTLRRGIAAFPSVGDPVLLPTERQLHAIVQARGSDRRIHIGVSPLASNARVYVDPDKLFGRHLAVLGNTGSGKSCSVAGLVRWSLASASKALSTEHRRPNARFIILDPNGEYASAFADLTPTPRVIRVPPVAAGELPLSVPAWMWNSREWSAFAFAQR
jgi:DNA helicase HerA-like ATPase